MADTRDVSTRQAGELLGEVERVRARARGSSGPPWFPLICFGAVTIITAGLLRGHLHVALLPQWLGAGLLGMWLVGRHYRRRADDRGAAMRDRRTWALAGGLFGACLFAGLLAGDHRGLRACLEAVIVVVIAAYLMIGWRLRSGGAAIAPLPGGLAAIVLAAGGGRMWVFELIFGVGLVLAGVGLRMGERGST